MNLFDKYAWDDQSSVLDVKSPDLRDADRHEVHFTNVNGYDLVKSLNDTFRSSVNILDLQDNETFTLYARGTLQDIVQIVAAGSARQWTVIDGRFILAKSLTTSRAACRLSIEGIDYEAFEKVARTSNVEVLQLKNGQVVCVGTVDRLKEIERIIDVLSSDRSGYILTVAQITTTRDQLSDLRANVNFSAVDLIQEHLSLYDVFEARCSYELSKNYSDRYLEQTLYLNEGREVNFNHGTTKERENTQISQYGVVTSGGWTTSEDGITLKIKMLAVNHNSVDLSLAFESSKFNEDFNKTQNKLDYDSVSFDLGRIYYVTQIEDSARSRGFGAFSFHQSENNTVTSIWCCVHKISKVVQ